MKTRLLILLFVLSIQAVSAEVLPGTFYVYFSAGLPSNLESLAESNENIRSARAAFPLSSYERLQNTAIIESGLDQSGLSQLLGRKYSGTIELEAVPAVEPLYSPNDIKIIPSIAQCGIDKPNYHLNLLAAEAAWEITTGSSDIKIAIIDQGFDPSHPDFINADGSSQVVFWDSISANPTHGTFVAGCAAASTDNHIGIGSIGFNSKLMLYTRLGDYSALYEAAAAGAKIINLSWGGLASSNTQQLVMEEIYKKGVVVVASAGNGAWGLSSLPYYPASYDYVIGVTSIGAQDQHKFTYLSPGDGCATKTMVHQHNDFVDIAAPGYEVVGLLPGGNYGISSGTSMASPMVAGVVALMLSIDPSLKPAEIENILACASRNIDAQNQSYIGKLGSGRLDAYRSVYLTQQLSASLPLSASVEERYHCDQELIVLEGRAQGGVAPYTYKWKGSSGTGSEKEVITKGIYQLTVSDAACRTEIVQHRVYEMISPMTLEPAAASLTVNQGEMLFLKAGELKGGSSQIAHRWFGLSGFLGSGPGLQIRIMESTDLTLEIEDILTGCQISQQYEVTVIEQEDPMGEGKSQSQDGNYLEDKVRTQMQATFFPNPITDILHVNLPGDQQYILRIRDMAGREIRVIALDGGQVDISRGGLSSGIYYFEFTGELGTRYFEKIAVR